MAQKKVVVQGLSERNLDVYRYIERFIEERGYAPSYREIGEGLGILSSSSVAYHLKALREQGVIEQQVNKNRTIVLLGS